MDWQLEWQWMTGAFIEMVLVIFMGFTFLGYNIKNRSIRIVIVSLYSGILVLIVNSSFAIELVTLTLGLVIPSVLFRFTLNIRILHAIFILLSGSIILLILNLIVSDLLSLPDFGHYALTWSIALFIMMIIKRYNLQLYLPDTLQGKGILYRFIWLMLLLSAFSMYLSLYFSVILLDEQWKIFLAFSSVIVIFLSLYLGKKLYEGKVEHFETSINEEYDSELNHYIDLILNQKQINVEQLLKIRMLLETGQLQRTKDYVDKLFDEATLNRDVALVGSQTVSGILQAYKAYAAQKSIHLQLDIQDSLSNLPFHTYEIHKILKSLIQHAFVHSEKLPVDKRSIYLKIEKTEGSLQFLVFHKEAKNAQQDTSLTKHLLSTIGKITSKYHGQLASDLLHNQMRIKVDIPLTEKE